MCRGCLAKDIEVTPEQQSMIARGLLHLLARARGNPQSSPSIATPPNTRDAQSGWSATARSTHSNLTAALSGPVATAAHWVSELPEAMSGLASTGILDVQLHQSLSAQCDGVDRADAGMSGVAELPAAMSGLASTGATNSLLRAPSPIEAAAAAAPMSQVPEDRWQKLQVAIAASSCSEPQAQSFPPAHCKRVTSPDQRPYPVGQAGSHAKRESNISSSFPCNLSSSFAPGQLYAAPASAPEQQQAASLVQPKHMPDLLDLLPDSFLPEGLLIHGHDQPACSMSSAGPQDVGHQSEPGQLIMELLTGIDDPTLCLPTQQEQLSEQLPEQLARGQDDAETAQDPQHAQPACGEKCLQPTPEQPCRSRELQPADKPAMQMGTHSDNDQVQPLTSQTAPPPVKRGRGRPRKHAVIPSSTQAQEGMVPDPYMPRPNQAAPAEKQSSANLLASAQHPSRQVPEKIKRGRGRPRKQLAKVATENENPMSGAPAVGVIGCEADCVGRDAYAPRSARVGRKRKPGQAEMMPEACSAARRNSRGQAKKTEDFTHVEAAIEASLQSMISRCRGLLQGVGKGEDLCPIMTGTTCI